MKNNLILSINPGSTSTKLAVFEKEKKIFSENVSHSSSEIARYNKIFDQKDFRSGIVIRFLENNKLKISDLAAVVGRELVSVYPNTRGRTIRFGLL